MPNLIVEPTTAMKTTKIKATYLTEETFPTKIKYWPSSSPVCEFCRSAYVRGKWCNNLRNYIAANKKYIHP